jgi:O-methyltransferase
MKNEIRINKPIETVPYGHTVIPDNRLEYLVKKCEQTLKKVPGNILEIGVYRGGTIIRLSKILKDTCPEFIAIGVDTFTGHPYTDNHPVHPKRKYADVDLEDLQRCIKKKNLDKEIKLHKGKIEEIFIDLDLKNISFAHIDCDLYIPVKFCAQHVPGVMNKKGVIYFDDYGHEHCPGATKAVREKFNSQQIHEVYIPEDNTCWSCYIQL